MKLRKYTLVMLSAFVEQRGSKCDIDDESVVTRVSSPLHSFQNKRRVTSKAVKALISIDFTKLFDHDEPKGGYTTLHEAGKRIQDLQIELKELKDKCQSLEIEVKDLKADCKQLEVSSKASYKKVRIMQHNRFLASSVSYKKVSTMQHSYIFVLKMLSRNLV